MRLIIFAIYLGIGAMLHALFVGPQFDWSSAWTLAWLFCWPLMLLATGGIALAAAAMVGGIVWALWEWLKSIAEWRARKRRA